MYKTIAAAAVVAVGALAVSAPAQAGSRSGCVNSAERQGLELRMTMREVAEVAGSPGTAVHDADTWQERAYYCKRNDTLTVVTYRLGSHSKAWRLAGVERVRDGAAMLDWYGSF